MEASPVKAGEILAGKYRIERVLGEGGMGVVVEALDMGLERRVAIKFLLPDFAKHAEATERFTREARAAVKIQSEHVARVIDVSKLENGSPYMVMEFLEGADLSQVIEDGGALPVEDTALYVIQACEALAEAHAYGIVHRDLKPANLFLAQQAGGSRKIKVLDFGISKTLNSAKGVGSLTRTSTTMGSPLYMSPEQMKNSRDVDLRTDIWALGIILHEALAGETPFTGTSIPEISAQILLEDPTPLNEINPEIPQTLADVVTRAMRKQPEMRFQNVGDLAMALLPFAPNRARNNVERIIRVLNAAGMAEGEFQASLAPNQQVNVLGTGVELLKIENISASRSALLNNTRPAAGTMANWGQTHSAAASSRQGSRRLLLAGAASLLAIAGGVGLVLNSNAPPPTTSEASGLSASAAAAANSPPPAPVAPTAPTITPIAPVVEKGTAQPDSVEEQAAETTPDPEPAAADSTVAPTPEPKAAVATAPPKAAAPRARKVRRTRRVAKPKAKSYSGDFKSKFGSRK